MTDTPKDKQLDPSTEAILSHWRDTEPNDRLAHLIRDAARGVTRALQLRLSEYGISFGHWAFLRILWDREGLTQRELSIAAGLMEPTTHSAVLKMEQLGYLTRRHRKYDQKRFYIYLTDKGRDLKETLIPHAIDVNSVALKGVPESHVEITRATLLAMIQNLADDEASALAEGKRITATRDLVVNQDAASRKS